MEAASILERFFPSGDDRRASFIALSGNKCLRWILPARETRTARVLGEWRPYKLIPRLGWGIIRAAVRGGFLGCIPGVKTFEADISATDWRDFGWEEKDPPILLAYVGTPGTHRKLVITLADPRDGKGRVIVKFPLVESAWPKIAREYSVLQDLQKERCEIGPIPVLIDHNKQFTVQTYMEGHPTGISFGTAHVAFLAALIHPDKRVDFESERAALVEKRLRLIAAGQLSPEVARLTEKLLAEGEWRGQIPAVRIHGDFAPWNLKERLDGSLCATDWEESQAEGLPFYDLHHYELQVTHLLGVRVKVMWYYYARALSCAGKGLGNLVLEKVSNAAKMQATLRIFEESSRNHDENLIE